MIHVSQPYGYETSHATSPAPPRIAGISRPGNSHNHVSQPNGQSAALVGCYETPDQFRLLDSD